MILPQYAKISARYWLTGVEARYTFFPRGLGDSVADLFRMSQFIQDIRVTALYLCDCLRSLTVTKLKQFFFSYIQRTKPILRSNFTPQELASGSHPFDLRTTTFLSALTYLVRYDPSSSSLLSFRCIVLCHFVPIWLSIHLTFVMHLWGVECATAYISLQFLSNSHIYFYMDVSVHVKRVACHIEHIVFISLCKGMGLLLHSFGVG